MRWSDFGITVPPRVSYANLYQSPSGKQFVGMFVADREFADNLSSRNPKARRIAVLRITEKPCHRDR